MYSAHHRDGRVWGIQIPFVVPNNQSTKFALLVVPILDFYDDYAWPNHIMLHHGRDGVSDKRRRGREEGL